MKRTVGLALLVLCALAGCKIQQTSPRTPSEKGEKESRYMRDVRKDIPFAVSELKLLRDDIYTFHCDGPVDYEPDEVIDKEGICYIYRSDFQEPRQRQPETVIWRNTVVNKRHKRVLCIDRYMLNGKTWGMVCVLQSACRRYDKSDIYHWDVSDVRMLRSIAASLDGFTELSVTGAGFLNPPTQNDGLSRGKPLNDGLMAETQNDGLMDETVSRVGYINLDTIQGVPCCVYLPYDYLARAERKEQFRVLYLQHGMFGDETDWPTQGLMPILDSLLALNEIPEMVIVMPDNCPHRDTYEEEKDNATNGHWEAQFAAFMDEAESRYSISRDPAHRAIAGLSMGGYHTMTVSSALDGQFRYVGMFSPATFVHRMPSEPSQLWIAIGKEDFLYDSLQEYRRWLDANHREYTYYESTGGHDWPNWRDYLVRFLKIIR